MQYHNSQQQVAETHVASLTVSQPQKPTEVFNINITITLRSDNANPPVAPEVIFPTIYPYLLHSMGDDGYENAPDWRTQAPYDSGIKRKRVTFVPASTLEPESPPPKPGRITGSEASSLYLSLVGLAPRDPSDRPLTCPTCSLPITNQHDHEKSTAHQYALPHSHPPHHYDRASLGLKVMMDSGWDPDQRKGLGRDGEGIRFPIKPVPKNNTLGIGVKLKRGKKRKEAEKVKKIVGPKESRTADIVAKARRAILMKEMGGGIDVEAILHGKS
jgi:hypothetical protein